jgi:SAM-dependent methyltransferase
MSPDETQRVLKAFLNVYWLRPETAVWRARDVMELARFDLKAPMLDLGSGDGIFSFIWMGGELGPDFDAFQTVEDTAGFFQNRDIYDQVARELKPTVVTAPRRKIDVALDWKSNLLTKASWLGLYGSTVQHDANQPLPFPDASYNTIFCNIAYWIENLAGLLKEIGRVLRPGGQAILMVPNTAYQEYLVYNYWLQHGWEWAKKLDRGRYEQHPHVYSDAVWRKHFTDARLAVSSHTLHLSRTLVKFWDIGLRPLSPPLIRMANALDPKVRLAAKKEWIDILGELMMPLLTTDFPEDQGKAPAFHCYGLTRS